MHKSMKAMDLGAELGAQVYVMWGGREGVEVDAANWKTTLRKNLIEVFE